MRVQHNIMAMSAYRNYTNNVSAMKKNLEKLSSGYKINRAGDDAAGLAISEKMRAQITGLETAQKNAKDGISLVQTAEGALTEVHDMLNRMVELATQSANGTYDNTTDRAQLQKEMDQLRTEINRIADSSNFNGIKLLDGSMDAETGSLGQVQSFSIAPEGSDLQANTILHKGGDPETAAFSLELHNYKCDSAMEGDELTIKLGGKEFTTTVEAGDIDGTTGELDFAKAIARAVGGKELNGVTLTATPDGTGKVDFTGTANTELDVDLHVESITIAPAAGLYDVASAGVAANTAIGAVLGTTTGAAIAGTPAGGVLATAASKAIKLTLGNASDIDKALADNNVKLTSDANLTISANASGGWDLMAGTTKIGHADALAAAIGTGAYSDITFKSLDGNDTLATVQVAAKDASITASNANKLALTLSGVKATAVKTGTTAAATKGFKDALASAAAAASKTGAITIAATSGGAGLEVQIDGEALAGVTVTASITGVKLTVDGNDYTIAISGLKTGADAAAVAAMLGDTGSIATGLTVSEPPATRAVTGTYNEYTTENTTGVDDTAGQLASTKFELKEAACKEGSYIQIGAKKYTIASGDDNEVDGDTIKVKADILAEGGDKLVDTVGQLLSQVTDNPDFTIGYGKGTNTLSVHEKALADGEKHAFETKGDGFVEGGSLDTMAGFEKLLGFGTAGQKGRGLTLQIGDTADDFNKIQVNIKDMHTNAMGIADISIADQDAAAEAVKKIKEAINYVSDVRGTLGATQNRLDHTINNLSVMTENIQDAESTIRDVDIAEEMMAYTKNNILIQSAQAMLAQANQVPQGVLQLLQ